MRCRRCAAEREEPHGLDDQIGGYVLFDYRFLDHIRAGCLGVEGGYRFRLQAQIVKERRVALGYGDHGP